jgi:hypothetical protein
LDHVAGNIAVMCSCDVAGNFLCDPHMGFSVIVRSQSWRNIAPRSPKFKREIALSSTKPYQNQPVVIAVDLTCRTGWDSLSATAPYPEWWRDRPFEATATGSNIWIAGAKSRSRFGSKDKVRFSLNLFLSM